MTDVSPTLARRMLLAALTELHDSSGMTHEAVARRLGISAATFSRWINGKKQTFRTHEIESLCRAYRVDGATTEQLVRLAESAHRRGITQRLPWGQPYRFDVYLALERDATSVETYESSVVPGLLQTPEYATATIRATVPDVSDERLADEVAVRMDRQAAVYRPERPLRVTAYLDEGVLYRRIPDPGATRRQLERLRAAAELPNIDLRIIPQAAGPHPASGIGPFVVLSFNDVTSVVYVETLIDARYLERADEVAEYRDVSRRLSAVALPPDASATVVDAAIQAFPQEVPG